MCHLVFPRGAASKDVGGLFNQGLLQRSGTGNDYQEAPVASEIGTADNVSSDGCEILLMHLSLLLSTQETTMHAD